MAEKIEGQVRVGFMLYYFLFNSLMSIIFGALLIVYRNDDDKNDGCDSYTFKAWVLATAIIVLIQGVASFFNCCIEPTVLMGVDFCMSILRLIMAIGTQATADSECGKLFQLAQAFSITQYALFGLKIFLSICLCKKMCS